MVDQLHLHARRCRHIGDGRRRHAGDEEEGVDLAVLEGIGAFGRAETLARHVLVLVHARGLDQPEGEDLGAAARRAGRYALALEVLELGDAAAFERHDLHQVRVHDARARGSAACCGELVAGR